MCACLRLLPLHELIVANQSEAFKSENSMKKMVIIETFMAEILKTNWQPGY